MDLRLAPGSRIMLIDPPFFRLFGYTRWHYPVTLTVVGSYLQEQGYEVCVYDADRPTADCRGDDPQRGPRQLPPVSRGARRRAAPGLGGNHGGHRRLSARKGSA